MRFFVHMINGSRASIQAAEAAVPVDADGGRRVCGAFSCAAQAPLEPLKAAILEVTVCRGGEVRPPQVAVKRGLIRLDSPGPEPYRHQGNPQSKFRLLS
jgi:hypothetical protein